MKIWPGQSYPLGSTWDGSGVNFALFSKNATGVELCLFDPSDPLKETRQSSSGILMPRQSPGPSNGTMPIGA
ncbi:MAG: hypothetical protein M0033_12205 [Nitrospiraceae bacterium]|nr:hypothetical protein [Nitrospiraceae bacterium]